VSNSDIIILLYVSLLIQTIKVLESALQQQQGQDRGIGFSSLFVHNPF
jgi:hypothetical protein